MAGPPAQSISLQDLLAQHGAMSSAQTIQFALNVTKALGKLHASGKLYGSLSAASVLNREGRMSLAPAVGEQVAMGPMNTPPELAARKFPALIPRDMAAAAQVLQESGEGVPPARIDISSLGRMLLQMHTLHTAEECVQNPSLADAIPPSLRAPIDAMLGYSPIGRCSTLAECQQLLLQAKQVEELSTAAGQRPVARSEISSGSQVPATALRSKTLLYAALAGGTLVVVFVIVAMIWWLAGDDTDVAANETPETQANTTAASPAPVNQTGLSNSGKSQQTKAADQKPAARGAGSSRQRPAADETPKVVALTGDELLAKPSIVPAITVAVAPTFSTKWPLAPPVTSRARFNPPWSGFVPSARPVEGLKAWQIGLASLPVPASRQRGYRPPQTIWNPNGTQCAVFADSQFRIYDVPGWRLKKTYLASKVSEEGLAWNPVDGSFAAIRNKTQVEIWQPADDTRRELDPSPEPLTGIAWSPDGSMIAGGGSFGSVMLWKSTGQLISASPGHVLQITSLAFSPDQSRLATIGQEGRLVLWSMEGAFLRELGLHQSGIDRVFWSPDSQRLVTGGPGIASAKIWNLQDANTHQDIANASGVTVPVGWDMKRNEILTVSPPENSVATWKQDGKLARQYTAADFSDTNPVYIDWAPNGEFVRGFGANNEVYCWDREGRRAGSLEPFLPNVVRCSRDGKWIATAYPTGRVLIHAANGQVAQSFQPSTFGISALEWSPDCEAVAVGDLQGAVSVWELTGRKVAELKGHTAQVSAMCWNPLSNSLATVSIDSTLRVWGWKGEPGLVKNLAEPASDVSWSANNEGIVIVRKGALEIFQPQDGSLLKSCVAGAWPNVQWRPNGIGVAIGVSWFWLPGRDVIARFVQRETPKSYRGRWSHQGDRLASSGSILGYGQAMNRLAGSQIKISTLHDRPFDWSGDDSQLVIASDSTLRFYDSGTGKMQGVTVVLTNDKAAVVSASGELLSGSPGDFDGLLIYCVQTEAGEFEYYQPSEFYKRYINRN